MLLFDLFKSPSAFRDNWKAYARNQIAHMAVVGALPVFLFGDTAFLWVMALYPVWEGGQWALYNADLSDAFEDSGFVMGAAMVTHSGYYWMFVFLVFFLLSGILWRKSEAEKLVIIED